MLRTWVLENIKLLFKEDGMRTSYQAQFILPIYISLYQVETSWPLFGKPKTAVSEILPLPSNTSCIVKFQHQNIPWWARLQNFWVWYDMSEATHLIWQFEPSLVGLLTYVCRAWQAQNVMPCFSDLAQQRWNLNA
jgi:hypothetical protein